MTKQPKEEETYLKKVYRNIILLALLAHGSYIFIFTAMQFYIPAVYNTGSVIFYCLMLYATHRGRYRLSVSLIHIEVCLFAAVCSFTGGWSMGVAYYLIAMSSLVYFCPFRRKYIPYLFAFAETGLFFILFFYLSGHPAYYPEASKEANQLLFLFNAATCFVIIIYSAFLSKVSAVVTQQQLAEENDGLSMIANYDQLTGLLTRRAFMNSIKVHAHGGKRCTLVMADIDNFKIINDHYGHQGGDYVLRTVAELMRTGCREADICRYGGEEFVIIFHDHEWGRCVSYLRHLCRNIALYPFRYLDDTFQVTVTFGMCKAETCRNIEDMIACADRRLYIGKANGKNQVVVRG